MATKDLTCGSIWKQLVEFTIPLLIGDLFQQFYNLADSVIVGRFVGKAALAAVGATTVLSNTVIGLFMGVSVGAGVVISQCFGARDTQRLSLAVRTTLAITLIMGIVFTLIGVVTTPYLLRFMATPDDVFDTADLYLSIYFGGVSGLIVYNMAGGILRAVGDSKRPVYALILSAMLNVGLDLLFVIQFHWGVAGAAAATVIAQFLSAGYQLYALYHTDIIEIRSKKMQIDKRLAVNILTIGIPVGLQRTITSFSNVLVQSYVNAYESDCMAGWTIFNKIQQFAVLPIDNIGIAATTFTGQNYGAGNIRRTERGLYIAWGLSAAITAMIAAIVTLAAEPLAGLFSSEQAVIQYGAMFVRLMVPLLIFPTVTRTYSGVLRGLGDGKGPMYLMLLGYVLIRQLYLKIGTIYVSDIRFVAMSYPVGWIATSMFTIIYYYACRKKLLK